MKHTRAQWGRRLLPIILLFIGLVGQSWIAPPAGGGWYYRLIATSAIPNIGGVTYDDWEQGGWNCGQAYLFTTYTDDEVSLQVQASSTAPGNACSCTDVYIWRYGDAFPSSPSTYPVGSAFDLHPTVQGLYTIEVFNHGDNPASATPLLTGFIISILRVKSVWIDAPPVCLSDLALGSYYHFQVKTDPPISSIINAPGGLGNYVADTTSSGPVCESIGNPYSLQYSFNPFPCSDSTFTGVLNVDTIAASSSATVFSFVNDSGHDLTNYYLSDGDLLYFLTGTSCPGLPLTIRVTYTDIPNGESITVTAPIIIESPAVLDTAASPIAPFYFPPQATKTPQPSYDFYDYTVSGVEGWSPTSNPVTAMRGGGTDSIIRIQDKLDIPAGSLLYLSEGMTVEMGPQAAIVLDAAADTASHGGKFVVSDATLTAYRGCGDALGTDESTWAGVTVSGNPSFPQVNSAGVVCQGYLDMVGTTLSYADVGVQNGTGSANAGGVIQGGIGIGGNNFYNNRQAALVWPYTNISGGVETSNLFQLNSSTFNNDADAWFTASSFIKTTGVNTTGCASCTFINNTGSPMATAITGLDAGLQIRLCKFSNFQNAVLATAPSSTHAVTISNCTFYNNHTGIALYGSIAPNIQGNTFNMPGYNATLLTAFPGTSIVVPDQVVGALMVGSSAYTLVNNTFRTDSLPYAIYTSGTLEYNTGSDNNQVTGNTFVRVGVAMNANYTNNHYSTSTTMGGGGTGLQYLCNTDSSVYCDISALSTSATVGINQYQGTYYPYTTTPEPAGNVFGSTLANFANSASPLTYTWASGVADEDPVYISTPTTVFVDIVSGDPECYAVSGNGPYGPGTTLVLATNTAYSSYNSNNAPVTNASVNYAIAAANLNYYMTDSIVHRDSIYYWAGQLNSPYGDLLTANLLIEDNLIDSANTIYNAITTKYSLDSAEANDFTQGRYIEDILISLKEGGGNVLTLSGDQVTTLQSVAANSSMWAHARAEGWLYVVNGTAFADSLLYPVIPENNNNNGNRTANTYHPAPPQIANKVYPNPVTSTLQVIYTAKTNDPIVMQVEDVSGRTLIAQPLQSGVPAAIDMSSLAPGMYLYRIFEGTNTTMAGKVVKE